MTDLAALTTVTLGADTAAALARELGEPTFSAWFKDAAFECLTGGKLVVAVATAFKADHIRSHFDGPLHRAAACASGKGIKAVEVQVIVRDPSAALPRERRATPTAQIVQFPLPFPTESPPVCNVIARSALFAAIKGKDRRIMRQELIASQDDVAISFTGQQFNQDDHDTFMFLVQMASHKPLGETVIVPANALLRVLGRSMGKSQHEQLRTDIMRLVEGTVIIKARGMEYIGHLIDSALQDSDKPQHKRHWAYRLNPELVKLFAPERFTFTDWDARLQLSQRDLARWLQLWLESNAENYPIAVATILARCGSKNRTLFSFRQRLRDALEDLKKAGIVIHWAIDNKDLVHIERTPSDSQKAYLRRKAATKHRKHDVANKPHMQSERRARD